MTIPSTKPRVTARPARLNCSRMHLSNLTLQIQKQHELDSALQVTELRPEFDLDSAVVGMVAALVSVNCLHWIERTRRLAVRS